MKPYSEMKPERISTRETLPAGGYVCKIKDFKEVEYSWGTQLVLCVDIAEGEYTSFFKRDYENNTNEDKKWRGTFRIVEPNEDSKYFKNEKKNFNQLIGALEDSNPSYHFDCLNLSELKGKLIGILYRNKEWEYKGSTGWTTEAAYVRSADDIREGNFKIPTAKALKKSIVSASAFADLGSIDDSDLPF